MCIVGRSGAGRPTSRGMSRSLRLGNERSEAKSGKACAVTVEGPQFGPVLYGTRGEIVVATLGSLSQASRRTLRGAATRGDIARRRSQMSERMRFGIFMAPFHPPARTRRC